MLLVRHGFLIRRLTAFMVIELEGKVKGAWFTTTGVNNYGNLV